MNDEHALPITLLSANFLAWVGVHIQQQFMCGEKWLPAPDWQERISKSFIPLLNKEFNLPDMCDMATKYFMKVKQSNTSDKISARIALACCLTFLRVNKIFLKVPEMDLFQIALDTYYGETSEEEFSSFLQEHVFCLHSPATWNSTKKI